MTCNCRSSHTLCGVDVDDLFAYTAHKSVKIRDHRLGLLHYCLMFFIVLYIMVYQLIAKLGYLKFTAAQNTVRLTLQQPTVDSCNPNKPTCEDKFPLLGQLSYCCASNTSCHADPTDSSCKCDFRPAFKNYNCTYMDGTEASLVRQDSILVTTAMHEYSQKRNTSCYDVFPTGSGNCEKVWLVENDTIVFTAGVEAYTLLIDHVVTAPGEDIPATTSRSMDGMLYVSAGSDLQQDLCARRSDAVDLPFQGQPTHSAPCYLPPAKANGLDVFPLGDLLQAMGVSLDEESYLGSGHSARYEGIIANLVIEYSNTDAWRGVRDVRYVYKPTAVPQSAYEEPKLVSTSFPDRRMKQSMRGVLIEVQPGGSLARFDFTQLLLQLTTSLTLLAMATVIVNFLAQYVLRHRSYYKAALYDSTADFSDLSVVENLASFQLDDALRQRALAIGGSRPARILRLLEDGWRPEHRHSFRAHEAAGRDIIPTGA